MAHAAHSLARVKMERILFATDYSPCSERAMSFARVLARSCGATLCFLHVLPPEPVFVELPLDVIGEDHEREWNTAAEHLSSVVQKCRTERDIYEPILKRGEIPWVFDSVVSENSIDLVVLGTRGRGGLSKLVLGSVAEQVFRTVSCPVLTVGPHAYHGELLPPSCFTHILCAVDLTDGSTAPLRYAAWMAEHCGAKLTVLHVVPFSRVPAELDADARSAALVALRQLLPSPITGFQEPSFVVESGGVLPAILDQVDVTGADLIVIGTHHSRTPGIAAHVPWAIAHEVVAHAPCPVLSVRT